jgi:hypothetical protein
MPDKNIRVEYSLLYCGSAVLKSFYTADTISSLWEKFKNTNKYWTFEKFILTLDYLYTIGAIALKDGLIVRCNHD